jgi:hypothetical protein
MISAQPWVHDAAAITAHILLPNQESRAAMNQELSGATRPSTGFAPSGLRRAPFLLAAAMVYGLLSGCATYGQRMDDWVGQRYSEFLHWTGHEKEQQSVVADATGNNVYLVHANEGQNCMLSVVVDRAGFIQQWSSAGPSCR